MYEWRELKLHALGGNSPKGMGPAPKCSQNKPMSSAFGQRLARHRQALGESQLAFGQRLGLSQKQVSQFERGLVAPSLSTVQRLCNKLELAEFQAESLLLSAGYSVQPPRPRPGTNAVDQATRQLLARHEPFPAVVVDLQQNLIESNQAFARLLDRELGGDYWATTCGTGPRNLLRLGLHPAGMFPKMRDPVAWCPLTSAVCGAKLATTPQSRH